MNTSYGEPIRKIWSKLEKEKLLQLIKAEGHTNYDRIAASLPNKSPAAVKAKINKYKVLAKSLKPGVEDPIDFWLHSYFTPETDSLITKALLYIRLFEDHPLPEEVNGINLAAIYGFLHRFTLGHNPTEISPETWRAFEKELLEASEYVLTKSEREVLTYLSTFNTKQKPLRDYSRSSRDSSF